MSEFLKKYPVGTSWKYKGLQATLDDKPFFITTGLLFYRTGPGAALPSGDDPTVDSVVVSLDDRVVLGKTINEITTFTIINDNGKNKEFYVFGDLDYMSMSLEEKTFELIK